MTLGWFHSVTVLTKNELPYCSALADKGSEASSVVDDLFHEWVFSFCSVQIWLGEFFCDLSLLGSGKLMEEWLVSCPQQF